jgi:hypothetical protein
VFQARFKMAGLLLTLSEFLQIPPQAILSFRAASQISSQRVEKLTIYIDL